MEAFTLDAVEGRRRMRVMRRQALSHAIDRWPHSFPRALGAESGDPNIHTRERTFEEER
jgi:trehalose-6-phosphate synthase